MINQHYNGIDNMRARARISSPIEALVINTIKKDYPDLIKAFRQGRISYQSLLEIYDYLGWKELENKVGKLD